MFIRLLPFAVALCAVLALPVASFAGAATCGNGILELGEICDDGNLDDGDCCSSSCGMPTGCDAPAKAKVTLFDGGDDREDKMRWRWLKGTSVAADLGDPVTTTSWSFCVWDDGELVAQSTVAPAGICPVNRICWSARGSESDIRGYAFSDKNGEQDGIQLIVFKTGEGRAQVKVQGKGVALPLPGPVGSTYFNQTSDVTFQLIGSDANQCFESVFPTNLKSKPKFFKAKLP